MIGEKLGHYRILEKVGAGGMGEVYRAHDEQLDRDVALKVLPPQSFSDDTARARLLREARAAAALNHPHICTIHEVGEADGQAYIAMELIEGHPLADRIPRGGLPTEQVLGYGGQIAAALAHAHERGIVHRDLKSNNVVITSDGRAKVLDFGLAKRLSRHELVEAATQSQVSLTQPGAVLGTLPYMAPEQLRGQAADARSDVWALGVVLHEMAAGARPFQGHTGYELSSAILSQAPGPLPGRVPVELKAIVERCLAKEPAQRYQRAGEVRAALEAIATGTAIPWLKWKYLARRRWFRATAAVVVLTTLAAALIGLNVAGLRDRLFGPTTPKIESLAVLPLDNLSHDPEQDYFVDGMHEALITELSKISALKVISRTSAVRFKNSDKPMPQIARELDVDALIEGSVAREGDQVRITVQLIHGPTDQHLWAESYQRELRGVLALQSEVAQAVARQIRVTVTPAEATRLAATRPVNPEAYRHYLLGRHHWNKRTPEGFEKAAVHFQQAIDFDPTYALAYAGLADVYALQPSWGLAPPSEAHPRARVVALKSLDLDANLVEPRATLGLIKFEYDRDWEGAKQDLRRALELNPSYATGHLWYGQLLTISGSHEEAFAEVNLAASLDPLAPNTSRWVGQDLFYARRYDQAVRQLQKTVETYPEFLPPSVQLGKAYVLLGRYTEALAEAEKAKPLAEFDPFYGTIGWIYARAGRRAEALAVLRRLQELSRQQYIDPTSIATIYIGLGQKEEALTWLERAYEQRGSYLILYLKVDPVFDPLRSDPRFQDLLRRMNFPE